MWRQENVSASTDDIFPPLGSAHAEMAIVFLNYDFPLLGCSVHRRKNKI
jgi:hypothetical protein